MINLTKTDYIAQGSQRLLYLHPNNQDLCIKIPKEESNQRYVKREIYYTQKYQNRIDNIPHYHGILETDLGMGYVFDLVKNYDGSIASTLQEVIDEENLENIEQKIKQLYEFFLNQHIIVSDLNAYNILVKRTSPSDYQLWVVDGIGNSDFIKICDSSKFFLKQKLVRKFTRLSQTLKLDMIFG